jgi:hypothetical protein
MKFILFMTLTLTFLVTACDGSKDRAGATGSGAGIQEEQIRETNPVTGEDYNTKRMDAGGEDMNITTPISDEEKKD